MLADVPCKGGWGGLEGRMEVYILSRLVLFPGLLSPDLGLTWCKECKHPDSVDGEVTRGLWEVGSTGDLPLTASPYDLDCSLVPLDVFRKSLRRTCDLELGLCQMKSLMFESCQLKHQ
jgi:hypothetical protein